jgi:hypothetical protein
MSAALVLFMAQTAARISAAINMRCRDVDLQLVDRLQIEPPLRPTYLRHDGDVGGRLEEGFSLPRDLRAPEAKFWSAGCRSLQCFSVRHYIVAVSAKYKHFAAWDGNLRSSAGSRMLHRFIDATRI